MKVDLPELKRCCFCMPLRYGLLAWGYIRLALSVLLLAFMIINLTDVYIMEALLICVFVLLLVLDICLTIVFLIGGHRKTAKLLRVYYIYCIVMLCIYATLFTWTTGTSLYYVGKYISDNPEEHWLLPYFIQVRMLLGIVSLGLQMYIILLIRTEIKKLRNNTKFRFVNAAAESLVTLENETNENGINDDTTAYHRNGIEN